MKKYEKNKKLYLNRKNMQQRSINKSFENIPIEL